MGLKPGPPYVILLAQYEGEIVGHLQIFRNSSPRGAGIGELLIYLRQDFLNIGLGTMMMRRSLELAGAKRYDKVELEVVGENKNATTYTRRSASFEKEGGRIRTKARTKSTTTPY